MDDPIRIDPIPGDWTTAALVGAVVVGVAALVWWEWG